MRAHPVRLAAVLAAGVLSLGAISGCASSPGTVPSTGTDGLVVPTAAVAAGDFTDAVDNSWLPLPRGTELGWQVLDRGGRLLGEAVLEVLPEPRAVAGVRATAARLRVSYAATPGRAARTVTHTDLLAQDRAGHVWWLGREGEWLVGRDGAQAGLVVAASPRVGDGYRAAVPSGDEPGPRVEVLAAEETLTELRWTDTGPTTLVLSRGRGPVRVESSGEVWVLREATDPA